MSNKVPYNYAYREVLRWQVSVSGEVEHIGDRALGVITISNTFRSKHVTMNIFDIRRSPVAMGLYSQMGLVLILAIFLWASGMPLVLNSANAASLTLVSDTLTDSDLGVASGHTIRFTVQSVVNNTGTPDTIFVDFDPTGDNFQITDLDVADFAASTNVSVVSACTGAASEMTLATTTEAFTLTMCTGDQIATSTAVVLAIASSTSIITNPASSNDYKIHIETRNEGSASSVLDRGDAMVFIIDDVVVTASVDTTFDFVITGLASGTSVNGDTTSTTTSATAISFGNLTPGASVIGGQRLNVTTNAANGFTVTVKADQNLTSSTGADIDAFADGGGQFTPIAWTAPSNTLGSENTYGHFGITSEDSTLSTGDPFGAQLYAGNFATTTREVFYHNGPSNGIAADIGETDVAYQIEVESLQEAGSDYTATLTYVATPVF